MSLKINSSDSSNYREHKIRICTSIQHVNPEILTAKNSSFIKQLACHRDEAHPDANSSHMRALELWLLESDDYLLQ